MYIQNVFWGLALLGKAGNAIAMPAAPVVPAIPADGDVPAVMESALDAPGKYKPGPPPKDPKCQKCAEVSGVWVSTDKSTAEFTKEFTDTVTDLGESTPKSTTKSTPKSTSKGAGVKSSSKHRKRVPTVQQALLGTGNFVGGMGGLMVQLYTDAAHGVVPITTQHPFNTPITIAGHATMVPNGATAYRHTFGGTKKTWQMRGLQGCTAVVVMNPAGFWVTHLWETAGPGYPNGYSAHRAYTDAGQPYDRSDPDFQTMAINPMFAANPISADYHPITGLFGTGASTKILIVAAGGWSRKQTRFRSPRYPSHIQLLETTLRHQYPHAEVMVQMYDPQNTRIPHSFYSGTVTVDYTPFEAVDTTNNRRLAEARLYVEDMPAMNLRWHAMNGQVDTNTPSTKRDELDKAGKAGM
jgi:hypothetical protein